MLACCDRRCDSGFPTAPLAPGLRGAGDGTVDNPGRLVTSRNVRMGQRESNDNQQLSGCSPSLVGERVEVDDSQISVIDVVHGRDEGSARMCLAENRQCFRRPRCCSVERLHGGMVAPLPPQALRSSCASIKAKWSEAQPFKVNHLRPSPIHLMYAMRSSFSSRLIAGRLRATFLR